MRKYTKYIRSGFYWIARESEIPIIFIGVNWHTKTLHLSEKIDPKTLSKDEVLEYLKNWSEQHDLKHAGLNLDNVSTLAWKEKT